MFKHLRNALIAILLCSPTLQAQNFKSFTLQNVLLQQGTREIILNGLFASSSPSGSIFDVELGYGYFIRDFIEVGGTVIRTDNDFGDGYGFRVFGEYNYDTFTNWIPFAGASLGYFSVSPELLGSASGAELRAYVGTKVFLTEYLALTGTLGASTATDDIYLDDFVPESSSFDAELGIRVWF